MKILMTTDTYLPRLGGGEYHVYYLIKELRALGHEVTLCTTEPGDGSPEEGVVRMPYRGYGSLPAIYQKIAELSKNADVIHSHYSYRLAWIAATVAMLKRKPFVVTQHGLGLLPQAGATFLQEIPFRVWRYWSMRVARTIISTSDDLSIDIRKLGFGKKIVHISNGYDAERFTKLPPPPPPGDHPVLLTVRRLVPKNGIQYLVAALPRIKERFPHVMHVCVGDGRLQEDIEQLADRLHVRSSIEFLGPVGHDALIELYKKAHVVVIPSTAESTSLTCIEALALGKTVVASRVGGLIELLGRDEERGYLVPITDDEHCDYVAPMEIAPEKIDRLADAIIHAIEHPEEAKKRAERGATYVQEHLTWGIIARQTDQVYRSLLSSFP